MQMGRRARRATSGPGISLMQGIGLAYFAEIPQSSGTQTSWALPPGATRTQQSDIAMLYEGSPRHPAHRVDSGDRGGMPNTGGEP